ncbi:MAG: DUF2721 domain-containing protein [Thermoanaerobaculia bacterium]
MLPELATPRDVDSVISVLSAMITPAVLILASGSLILTTSNRLTRIVDRVRAIATQIEELNETATPHQEAKRDLLFDQLHRATRRARHLQNALASLYIALTMFIATSVGLGLIALLQLNLVWIPLAFGFIGSGLMFWASIYLLLESRIALTSTLAEMTYVNRYYTRDRRD